MTYLGRLSKYFVTEFRQRNTIDSISLYLIFSFPILAATVRHWASAIFLLLLGCALIRLRVSLREVSLCRSEQVLFGSLVLFFLSYILSSLVNSFDDGSLRILGKELRFLGFIPLLIYLKTLTNPLRALGVGCLIGILVNVSVIIYTIWGLGLDRSHTSVYGTLFIGPFTALILIPALYFLHTLSTLRLRQLSVFLTVLFALIVAVHSSRSAIIGVVLVACCYYLAVEKKRRYLIAFATIVILSIVAVGALDSGRLPSFTLAFTEFNSSFKELSLNDGMPLASAGTSIGARLELLRASAFIFMDNPVLGIGGYNFHVVINDYITRGIVSPILANANHPHNVFAEVLVSKGILGLFAFLAICLTSMEIFLRRVNGRKLAGIFGAIFLAAILSMMLTESAIAIKGNFISTFVLFLAVFVAVSGSNNRGARHENQF
jgi:O-antigen ligase